MPKISGLALGEIQKVSGLGLGSIQKVSGLGLGLLWQSISQLGMVKNGDFTVPTTYGTVTGWTAETGTTLSGNGIQVTTAGNYTIATNLTIKNNETFVTRQISLRLRRAGVTLAEGSVVTLSANSSQPYTLSDVSRAYSVGDIVTLEADANGANGALLSGGTVRLVPAV